MHAEKIELGETMFRVLAEQSPVGMFFADRDGSSIYSNPALLKMTGRSAESLMGLGWQSLFLERDKERVMNDMQRLVAGGETNEQVYRWHCDNEEVLWVRVSIKPARLDNENVGFVGTVVDVSGVHDQAQRLMLAEQRQDFMSALSHDLKNPLVGAVRVLELLTTGKLGSLTSEQLDILVMLKDSNRGLVDKIQSLINVYQYEKEAASLIYTSTDLVPLVQDAITSLESVAERRGIEINLTVPQTPVYAMAHQNSVRRLVYNLVDNAQKFSPFGGTVRIRLYTAAGYVILEVEDSGPGLSASERAWIFKKFWQGDTGHRYTPGTGLGLYLCHQIVDAHKGEISCVSERGCGSTFTVRLPAPGTEAATATDEGNGIR